MQAAEPIVCTGAPRLPRRHVLGTLAAASAWIWLPPAAQAFPSAWARKGLEDHHRLLAQLLDRLLLEDDWPRGLDTARRVRWLLDAHLLAEEHALYTTAERHGLLRRPGTVFGEHAQQKLDAARLQFSIEAGDHRAARRICRALRDEVVGHSAEEEGGLYLQLLQSPAAPGVADHYRRLFASVQPPRTAWLP